MLAGRATLLVGGLTIALRCLWSDQDAEQRPVVHERLAQVLGRDVLPAADLGVSVTDLVGGVVADRTSVSVVILIGAVVAVVLGLVIDLRGQSSDSTGTSSMSGSGAPTGRR